MCSRVAQMAALVLVLAAAAMTDEALGAPAAVAERTTVIRVRQRAVAWPRLEADPAVPRAWAARAVHLEASATDRARRAESTRAASRLALSQRLSSTLG